MMVALGNFLFRYRNSLFPVLFLFLFTGNAWPAFQDRDTQTFLLVAGILLGAAGQFWRGLTIGLAYIRRGGKNKQVYAEVLVQDGIFAHCRNPLYLGNLLMITGLGIASNSLPFVLVGLPLFYLAYAAIIAAEENFLRGKFGGEYATYCARVNRLIPKLTGLRRTLRSMDYHWDRLIAKEYQTIYFFGLGAFLLVAKHLYIADVYQTSRLALWLSILFPIVLTAAFLIARWLKKSRRLRVGQTG
ncbi:isoprenylcysteine carboxylmethyltransferase family protein [Methylococcus sp. EFPC2]|uniref:methyltransferase family protein n=1 Tax=Methylococcus sp. EFPC2 TaxID=2812648 RepID=UPI0019682924|nr:isoprenylcysteine carboxylmethyltransferase family protein [Methylococcus sp. EFPC2]QSA97570.1 hypothetical protein JWZ97_01615 [Methylococcus sp. EFPC2]